MAHTLQLNIGLDFGNHPYLFHEIISTILTTIFAYYPYLTRKDTVLQLACLKNNTKCTRSTESYMPIRSGGVGANMSSQPRSSKPW